MTSFDWTFDREFPDIECHAYAPARIAPVAPTRRRLTWRRFGRLLAGGVWLGLAVGTGIAIITAT